MAPVREVVREWGRIGVVGFGGPPAHIALLRDLCVTRRGWIGAREFEDANAACGLLPGPASTQLAIYCARRVGGVRGALAGGLAFILPGLVLLVALAALTLQDEPPRWVRGLAEGAGAAAVAVVAQAAWDLARAGLAPAARRPGWRAPSPTSSRAPSSCWPRARGSCSCCSAAGCSSSRCARGLPAPPAAVARAAARARLDGAQGRRAELRRRLRDRPAAAGRRRRRPRLDDARPVPQRGRARAAHPGAGDADGQRGRLGRRRAGGRARRRRLRVRALLRPRAGALPALRAPARRAGGARLPRRRRAGGDRRDRGGRGHPARRRARVVAVGRPRGGGDRPARRADRGRAVLVAAALAGLVAGVGGATL